MRIVKYSCYVVDIKIEYFGGLKDSKHQNSFAIFVAAYTTIDYGLHINFMIEKRMMEIVQSQ